MLYLEWARRILADIDETERLIATGAEFVPRGRLRVSSLVAFGECCLLPLVPKFLKLCPQVELDISLTDMVIDIVDERTDVALRSGPLRDSTLMARKIIEFRRVVVASPAYLMAHGVPRRPQDLEQHNCLRFNFRRSLDEWPFRDPSSGDNYTLPVSGNVHANTGVVMRQFALDGIGLARLGAFHVGPDIAEGKLVALLEDYNPEDIERIHAVYVGHEHLAARIRAFVDFLAASIGDKQVAASNTP